jgi:hypothetical protein
MFKVASVAGKIDVVIPSLVINVPLRVKMIEVPAPETANNADTAVSAERAILTLSAHWDAVSVFKTGTEINFGDPVIPAAVTVTDALPEVVIVPAAVAVSI